MPPEAPAVAVSAGSQHACALVAGATYCWGDNEAGQLGLGDTDGRLVPSELSAGASFRALAAGERHSCALDDLGQVHCWGDNSRGQLGQGDREGRLEPALVPLPERASAIDADFMHSCALLLDASLYCWGQNGEGELGQADAYPGDGSTAADGLVPLAVGRPEWRHVDTGQGHTCAVRLDGALFCWGRNSEAELGPDTRIQVREPIAVDSDDDWLSVDAGQHHTCALKQDLTLHCWGANTGSVDDEGAPLGVEGADVLASPTRVDARADYSALSTNTFHTCAVSRAAELLCWGRNAEGQLALGDTSIRSVPTLVGGGWSAVSVGRFATCALSSAAELACAGKNDYGELGTGDQERRSVLTIIDFQ